VNRSIGRRCAAASLTLLFVSCEPKTKYEVTILEAGASTRFPLVTGFAEYVELPGDRNELHLTLAGYPASCEKWIPPKAGESALTVVIVTPAEVKPTATSYPWSGIPKGDEPLKAAYSLPKAETGPRSRLFEPGGVVTLSAVELDPHGTVKGTLAYEYAGDADHPATRIDGGFEVKMCRFALAAH